MKSEITLAYIADAGQPGVLQDLAADLIHGWNVDGILAAGDNAGYDASSIEACWARFKALGVPIFPAWGNHDYAKGLDNCIAHFPDLPKPFGHGRYYHTQLGEGLLRLGVWHSGRDDSFTNIEPDGVAFDSAQYAAMAPAIAAAFDWWKIGMFHHPPTTRATEANRALAAMSHVFEDRVYDLILCGHTHTNEILLVDDTVLLNISSATQELETLAPVEISEGDVGTPTTVRVAFPAGPPSNPSLTITGVTGPITTYGANAPAAAVAMLAALNGNSQFNALYTATLAISSGTYVITIATKVNGPLAGVVPNIITGAAEVTVLAQVTGVADQNGVGNTTSFWLQGYNTGVCPIWANTTDNCITKLRLTPEAITWEIYKVATGALLYRGGIGARRANQAIAEHAPQTLPESEGGGARILPYREILHSVARRGGCIPEEDALQPGIAIQITEGANEAAKYAWEFSDWPELCHVTQMFPIANAAGKPIIPWRAQTVYGWQEIGVVLSITHTEDGCRPYCYELTPEGIKIQTTLPVGTPVWVRWRPMPIKFTSIPWDSAKQYYRDDLVYDEASGHVFRCYAQPTVGTTVEDNDFWEMVPVPHVLASPIKAGAEAMYLRSEGQFGSAQILESAMQALLEHEILQIHNQQQQTKFYRR